MYCTYVRKSLHEYTQGYTNWFLVAHAQILKTEDIWCPKLDGINNNYSLVTSCTTVHPVKSPVAHQTRKETVRKILTKSSTLYVFDNYNLIYPFEFSSHLSWLFQTLKFNKNTCSGKTHFSASKEVLYPGMYGVN
jgi:hypothetical protein